MKGHEIRADDFPDEVRKVLLGLWLEFELDVNSPRDSVATRPARRKHALRVGRKSSRLVFDVWSM